MSNKCARCSRRLKDPNATYGPICARKVAAEQALAEQQASSIMIQTTIRDGYAGMRAPEGPVVVRIRAGKQEPLRHLVCHSPDGFAWGYGGSGPADLARSIIADVTGDENPHPALYQAFKWDFVTGWGDHWEINLNEIRAWLKNKKAAQ